MISLLTIDLCWYFIFLCHVSIEPIESCRYPGFLHTNTSITTADRRWTLGTAHNFARHAHCPSLCSHTWPHTLQLYCSIVVPCLFPGPTPLLALTWITAVNIHGRPIHSLPLLNQVSFLSLPPFPILTRSLPRQSAQRTEQSCRASRTIIPTSRSLSTPTGAVSTDLE